METQVRRRSGLVCSPPVIALIAALSLIGAGCATTAQPQRNVAQIAQGSSAPVPEFSGFLGDYTRLQRGGPGQALYRYINPNVNWPRYHKVMIAPVTFWAGDTSDVSPADQQALCNYYYNALREQLSKVVQVVDQPGPGVMYLQTAIVDARAATPVLRTVSVVVPQARLLSGVRQLATGSYPFVGGARTEGKVTDSQTGQILAEFLDERSGTGAVRNAATWQWQDAERAMDHWAKQMADRLAQLQIQGPGPSQA